LGVEGWGLRVEGLGCWVRVSGLGCRGPGVVIIKYIVSCIKILTDFPSNRI